MQVTGIVAEYNPFHNGHLYQIQRACGDGAQAIVAVMSGNFVQRAEAAFMNKHSRAETAVLNGVDLVIELPLRFSIASAEHFALGAVYLLNSLGIIDTLFFGSESGDINELKHLTDILLRIEKEGLIKKYLNSGEPFVYARQRALIEVGAPPLKKPNDILAVEYLKALEKLNSSIIPVTIPRLGNYYNSEIFIKDDISFLSASEIRKRILKDESVSQFIPKTTFDIFMREKEKGKAPADMRLIERTILAFFRMAREKDFSDIYGINEGLENRIIKASGATGLEELYTQVKTKRYTMATIRRGILSSFFGIKKALSLPTYVHILAFNDTGRKLLKSMKSTCKLPIVNTLSGQQQGQSASFVKEECLAGDIYNLCTPIVGGIYSDFIQSPIYIS